MDPLPRLALHPSRWGESPMTGAEGVDQTMAMRQQRGHVT
jgi:hypothetical protein